MIIIQILGAPYYYLFPRLVMLYALSKAFKAMAEAAKKTQITKEF